MLTHPLLQGRSRGNDAVHANSGVADGQSDCRCGFWIPDSWAGTGKRGGIKDHRGAEGYKYAYHLEAMGTPPQASDGPSPGSSALTEKAPEPIRIRGPQNTVPLLTGYLPAIRKLRGSALPVNRSARGARLPLRR